MGAEWGILGYLWRLEGIVCGKVDGQEEDPSLVWTISLLDGGEKQEGKMNAISASCVHF